MTLPELARKWTDGCPHIHPEWDESRSAPLCCVKAAVREALEMAEKIVNAVDPEKPTRYFYRREELALAITALKEGQDA